MKISNVFELPVESRRTDDGDLYFVDGNGEVWINGQAAAICHAVNMHDELMAWITDAMEVLEDAL